MRVTGFIVRVFKCRLRPLWRQALWYAPSGEGLETGSLWKPRNGSFLSQKLHFQDFILSQSVCGEQGFMSGGRGWRQHRATCAVTSQPFRKCWVSWKWERQFIKRVCAWCLCAAFVSLECLWFSRISYFPSIFYCENFPTYSEFHSEHPYIQHTEQIINTKTSSHVWPTLYRLTHRSVCCISPQQPAFTSFPLNKSSCGLPLQLSCSYRFIFFCGRNTCH